MENSQSPASSPHRLLRWCFRADWQTGTCWIVTAVIALMTGTAAAQEAVAAQEAARNKVAESVETDPLQRSGEIQKIDAAIRSIAKLEWKGEKLQFNIPTDPQEVNRRFDQIRQLIGQGGGGSSWGGDRFEFQMNNQNLMAKMTRSKINQKGYETTFFAQENSPPNRSMGFSMSDDGAMQITINDSAVGYLLRIRQSPDGQFSVQELNGTQVFATISASFEGCCRENRQFVESRLIPALAHFGFGEVLTPWCNAVQENIVTAVGPWSDEEAQTVAELVEGLESDLYETRQQTSRRLTDASPEHRLLLSRVVNNARFSPEIRARIRSLIREKASEEELARMDFMDQLMRSIDADYLRALIDLQTDPASREILVAHLKTMESESSTETNTGDETPATASPSPETPPAADLLAESGMLQLVSAQTGALVHLAWKGDQIALDRNHWAESFSGQSIQELVDQVQSSVTKAQLPAKWFQPGGPYDIKAVFYPQVLFERIEEVVESHATEQQRVTRPNAYYGYRNASLNRQLDTASMSGSLKFDDQDQRAPRQGAVSIDGKPFQLTLTEKTEAGREIMIDAAADGELRILLTGETSNFIVQLLIDRERALVQDVRGREIVAFAATDFRQLLKEHPQYFTDSFFPLLRHLGISVAPDIAPLPETSESSGADQGASGKD